MAKPRGEERGGPLAARIIGSAKAVRANPRRATVIEGDVCRRLGIGPEDARLGELHIDVATVSGGRRLVEIVKVLEPPSAAPVAMYVIKESHGSEPASAERASALGIGPSVLDVSPDGVILEECFPPGLNIRQRGVEADESEHYARCLADLFLTLVRADEGELIYHKDERLEHVFIVGEGPDVHVKLIDWGWSTVWPLERIHEWGSEQFRWFYLQLSLGRPGIWRTFIDSLAERLPRDVGRETMSPAYADFARRQAASHEAPASAFLAFIVECGRLGLNTEALNAFVERADRLSGEALPVAWTEIVH